MGNSYNWHRRGDSLYPSLRPAPCNALIFSVPAMQVTPFPFSATLIWHQPENRL